MIRYGCRCFVMLAATVFCFAGCGDDDDEGACPAVVNDGISLEVTDSETGVPAAQGAIG